MTVEHYLNIPMSYVVFVINMLMLVLGLVVLGKKFVITTLASSFLYPAFLEMLDQIIGDYTLTEDKILCILFSAAFLGVGLGILIRAGASTGGLDIPPIVGKKLFRIPVSVTMNTMDFFILEDSISINWVQYFPVNGSRPSSEQMAFSTDCSRCCKSLSFSWES